MIGGIHLPGANPKARQVLSSRRPKQISERSAVRETRRVNFRVINGIFLMKGSEHRIEEFQVAIPLLSYPFLPAGAISLGVALGGSRQTLGIHDNGLWPMALKAQFFLGPGHLTAVAMEEEDHRSFSSLLPGGRRDHDRLAIDPIDGPRHRLTLGVCEPGDCRNRKKGKKDSEIKFHGDLSLERRLKIRLD